jgi:hypothetical protein
MSTIENHKLVDRPCREQTMTDEGVGGTALVTTDDEAAIRSLLTRLYNAWARGDGAAYAQCFAERSDYVTFNGIHLRGQAEIALVHTAGSGRKKSYQTYVLVKLGEDWLIRSPIVD